MWAGVFPSVDVTEMTESFNCCTGSIRSFLTSAANYGGFGYSLFWALDEPYPLPLEVSLSEIWPKYRSLVSDEREILRNSLGTGDMMVLFVYAARMATLAVREKNSDFLFNGLLAISLGRNDLDYRDCATLRVLMVDAARRLNALHLFAEAARFALPEMHSFFENPDVEHRGLRSMCFVMTDDAQDGFRYRAI